MAKMIGKPLYLRNAVLKDDPHSAPLALILHIVRNKPFAIWNELGTVKLVVKGR